jgi:hypothetical protein
MPEDLLNENTALGMVRSEHERIDDLLATCLHSNQPDFTRQATEPLVQELIAHETLERELFFPFLFHHAMGRPGFRPDKMQEAINENIDIRALSQRLAGLDPAGKDYHEIVQKISDTFRRHCYVEEAFGSMALEMNDADLHNDLLTLADRMRDRRAQLLSDKPDA